MGENTANNLFPLCLFFCPEYENLARNIVCYQNHGQRNDFEQRYAKIDEIQLQVKVQQVKHDIGGPILKQQGHESPC